MTDLAAPVRSCDVPLCEEIAGFYWHDAGPFGAGTFYGCLRHAPADATEIVGFPPEGVQPAEVQTPTRNEPDRPVPAATGTGFDEQRWVRAFDALDDAMIDQRQRGECVLFDLHAMWWTVPMELNIHEINAMIRARLAELERQPLYFHLGAVYRPQVAP